MTASPRYDAANLVDFATALLAATGLADDRSRIVAEILVEGDLLGHTTHGLQLLGAYLGEIEKGSMAITGDPQLVADRGGAVTWDGRRLPGPYLVTRALDLAMVRSLEHGVAAVNIRRSHHIACLAAYLRPIAEAGFAALILSSDPSVSSVAPFGGRTKLLTPNPLAAAFPTDGEPVILDVSMSTTTNGLTNRLHAEGKQLEFPWLLDAEGHAARDPKVLFTDPPGTILPLGGVDSGHKGYALGLLVEALTSALGGFGRADGATGWGASVFVQVIDPEAFGGRAAFARETGWVANAARATPPVPGVDRVRVPGERGLERRRQQLADGVSLYPSIMPSLAPWAEKLKVPLPAAR